MIFRRPEDRAIGVFDHDNAFRAGARGAPGGSLHPLGHVEAVAGDVTVVVERKELRRHCRTARIADTPGPIDADFHSRRLPMRHPAKQLHAPHNRASDTRRRGLGSLPVLRHTPGMAHARPSPLAPRPAHVPESLVVDFDIHADPALLADPHARVLELATSAPPVFWSPRNGGLWFANSHAANYAASRDTGTFSSGLGASPEIMAAMLAAMPPGTTRIPKAVPITLDPPEHTKYRAPLQKVFSPKTIAALRGSIGALARDLIGAVADKGGCEFMSEIAEPLPVQVFLKMLGLPLDRMYIYRALVKEHMASVGTGDLAGTVARSIRIVDAMRDVALKRRDDPRDDMLSLLWQIDIDGRPTTIEDIENYAVLLFIAGLDTVMNGMGLAMRGLALNPDLQARLRAEPKLIPEASEEILRRYSFTTPVRRVTRETELCGATLMPGDTINIFLAAADLDPVEFPDPAAIDLNRENNVHIGFGVGPHRCLGSHLARVELQVLYEEMLSLLPQFRLDPDQPRVFHGGHVIGIEHMHLKWDAA
jgi:cytochrome P450